MNATTAPHRTVRPARRLYDTYSVLTEKVNGRLVCFSTYSSQSEAERVANRLRTLGCSALVEPALSTEVPGLTRPE